MGPSAAIKPSQVARGIALSIVLGPVLVIGGAVAAISLIQFFFAGLNPFGWLTMPDDPGDLVNWAFGAGRNSAELFITFMLGGMVAVGAYAGIHWGFTGRVPD